MNIAEYKNIVSEVRPDLHRIARRITGCKDDAEDVVQEVCLRIWHMRNDLTQYENIKALCVTMTRNMSIDKVRVRKVEVDADTISELRYETEQLPDTILERKEIRGAIRDLIKMLPPLQQKVLRLKDIEGYDTDEIISIMGINNESVRNNLSRARKRLRDLVIAYQKNRRIEL